MKNVGEIATKAFQAMFRSRARSCLAAARDSMTNSSLCAFFRAMLGGFRWNIPMLIKKPAAATYVHRRRLALNESAKADLTPAS